MTQILRGMGQLSPEERPVIGKIANQIRSEVEGKIEETKANIQKKERDLRLLEEKIDVTLPGKKHRLGNRHPLTLALDEIKEIFLGMGFTSVEGPEVELTYYNFDALNVPKTIRHVIYRILFILMRILCFELKHFTSSGSNHGKQ